MADSGIDTLKCPRCGVGVDDDGDGDCAICASASNRLIRAMDRLRYENDRKNRMEHVGARKVQGLIDYILNYWKIEPKHPITNPFAFKCPEDGTLLRDAQSASIHLQLMLDKQAAAAEKETMNG